MLVENRKPTGIHLLVWTDDICVSYLDCDKQRVRALFAAMLARFPNGVHIGEEREGALNILGTSVVKVGPRSLFIHQKPFVEKLIEKSGFSSGQTGGCYSSLSFFHLHLKRK